MVQIWNDGLVPYVFDSKLSWFCTKVIYAMDVLTSLTGCVKFVRRHNQRDYLYITQGQRCSTHDGRLGGKQELLLEEDHMEVAYILHELCHALGLHHEHQRSIRDEYIRVHYQNIEEEHRTNFIKMASEEDIEGFEFDYSSIMIYDDKTFAKGSQPTMTSLKKHKNLLPTEEKTSLSEDDVKKIQKLYERHMGRFEEPQRKNHSDGFAERTPMKERQQYEYYNYQNHNKFTRTDAAVFRPRTQHFTDDGNKHQNRSREANFQHGMRSRSHDRVHSRPIEVYQDHRQAIYPGAPPQLGYQFMCQNTMCQCVCHTINRRRYNSEPRQGSTYFLNRTNFQRNSFGSQDREGMVINNSFRRTFQDNTSDYEKKDKAYRNTENTYNEETMVPNLFKEENNTTTYDFSDLDKHVINQIRYPQRQSTYQGTVGGSDIDHQKPNKEQSTTEYSRSFAKKNNNNGRSINGSRNISARATANIFWKRTDGENTDTQDKGASSEDFKLPSDDDDEAKSSLFDNKQERSDCTLRSESPVNDIELTSHEDKIICSVVNTVLSEDDDDETKPTANDTKQKSKEDSQEPSDIPTKPNLSTVEEKEIEEICQISEPELTTDSDNDRH